MTTEAPTTETPTTPAKPKITPEILYAVTDEVHLRLHEYEFSPVF